MGLTKRITKRILIFLLIPILAVIPFLVEDIIIRVISTIALIIYIAFIIFLRDSIYSPIETYIHKKEKDIEPEQDEKEPYFQSDYDPIEKPTDFGDSFKIISENKKIEVQKNSDSFSTLNNRRSYFKPPDLKENYFKIATENLSNELPQEGQFSFILEKILSVIKDAYLAHSALFFFVNKTSNRLTLERYSSSSNDIIHRKFDIEDDILGQIIEKNEPELLSEINPTAENDIIRYYSVKQGIKSFVGVPLFYNNDLTAILVLDSKETDAFGLETVYSLGKFVRVISHLISIFAERFEEVRAENRLKSIFSFWTNDKRYDEETELFSSIEVSVKQLIHWDAFALIYFNANEQKFKTVKIVNNTTLKYVGENLEVDLKDTLAGESILKGLPVKIDDTGEKEYKRYSKAEDVSFDGSFLAVPLQYDKQYYGLLCFESLKKNAYSLSDIKFMKNAVKIFSFLVYSYANNNMLKQLLSVDIETKLLNSNTFVERLAEDLLKAKELRVDGMIALIKIDDFVEQESLFEGNPFYKILVTIKDIIIKELPPIHLIGRLGEKIFAVYFFNATNKDAFLWAEKLRAKIARYPIELSLKQTTFTVSIGLASANHNENVEQILKNAELALGRVLEKGGNSVKSIN